MAFAQVAFNLPVHHTFTYAIPPDMNSLTRGMRVLTPFGKRTITGVVVNINSNSDISSPKTIIDVLDTVPLVNAQMLDFTQWLSSYYHSSWGQAIHIALPKNIDVEDKHIVHLLDATGDEQLTEKQRELYHIIGANPDNTTDFYKRKFGQQNFNYFINILEKKGLISRENVRREARVGTNWRKFVIVRSDYTVKRDQNEQYRNYIKKRPDVDTFMIDNIDKPVLMSEFLKTNGMANATLYKMQKNGMCDIQERPLQREPTFAFRDPINETIELTEEQSSVIRRIIESVKSDRFKPFLLHGVTGSGKTQVYIEILKHIIRQDKTAIILIPEIALTPQTVHRFKATFSEKIAVFHSKMSIGERYDAWMSCFHNRVKIVVGPRSALFVPLQSIGLIVVDEEHETTYKQTDVAPRYHARDVAVYLGKLHKAAVILGSATPSLESYHNAHKGKYELLAINNRVKNIKMPQVTILDMTKNVRKKTSEQQATLFSQILMDKIGLRLQKNEQVILLQNRRGFSSFMQCQRCGFIAACPNCDVTLTYHSFNQTLQCHFCGHRQPVFAECPNCGGRQIEYKGVGTQRIQNELADIVPQARIIRMDQDTTRGKNRHDHILKTFGDGKADILLGTQMIAKGLDFSNVTLVGVISADVGLALPDFRASEHVFQLLTQVAGRSGRGDKTGEVVIQTYQPAHYAIQFAKEHDYKGFFHEEMKHRQNFSYPPYFRIIQLVFTSKQMSNAITSARNVAINLKYKAKSFSQVIGPSPAAIPRLKNLYRWQLIIRINPQTDITGQNTKNIIKNMLDNRKQLIEGQTRVDVDVDPVLIH
ncbi:MAG: primosomal protein N' [Caldithrix sp.]|nr:primosomal protein N' [Caldithrix sp.]